MILLIFANSLVYFKGPAIMEAHQINLTNAEGKGLFLGLLYKFGLFFKESTKGNPLAHGTPVFLKFLNAGGLE